MVQIKIQKTTVSNNVSNAIQDTGRWMIWQPYPELCQLQGQLNKGIRAGPALLYQSFPKLGKQIAMEVYVISYLLG